MYDWRINPLLISTVKDGTPSEDELQRLSLRVVDEWEMLGRVLKFDDSHLIALHKENEKYSEKAYKMLLKWKQRDGLSRATFQVLDKALRDELVNRSDLAEKFCCI